MARQGTITRVHNAVLDLATTQGIGALTMEGIAAHAGVGKQTLYRTWPSVSAVIFDALQARDAPSDDAVIPDTGDLQRDLEEFLLAAIAAISTQPNETLLRGLAARIQVDESVSLEFRERLLTPQLNLIHQRLRRDGSIGEARTAELLLAPVFYRWFMRTEPMSAAEVSGHVRDVLACTAIDRDTREAQDPAVPR